MATSSSACIRPGSVLVSLRVLALPLQKALSSPLRSGDMRSNVDCIAFRLKQPSPTWTISVAVRSEEGLAVAISGRCYLPALMLRLWNV